MGGCVQFVHCIELQELQSLLYKQLMPMCPQTLHHRCMTCVTQTVVYTWHLRRTVILHGPTQSQLVKTLPSAYKGGTLALRAHCALLLD